MKWYFTTMPWMLILLWGQVMSESKQGQAEELSCDEFFDEVERVSDFVDEICNHPFMIPLGIFFKPLGTACTVSSVAGTISDLIDDPICRLVQQGGKSYPIVTSVVGICTTEYNNIDNLNCPQMTLDYNCQTDRYNTQFSEGPVCVYQSGCQTSYTKKYQSSCQGDSVFIRPWQNLDASCTFSSMKVRYQQEFCSSSKSMMVENFDCHKPEKPMTVFQFLHDDSLPVSDYVTSMYQWLNISAFVPRENFNVTLVTAQEFNTDPFFQFTGADFYFAYDDRSLNNMNAMNSVACKLVTLKSVDTSPAQKLSPFLLSSLCLFLFVAMMAFF